MAGETRAADNVGRLSVDVVADITELNTALGEVETLLGKIPDEKILKVSVSGITENQLKRLREAATLMERIQKTGIKPEAVAGAAPTKGGSTAASGNVNVAFKEEDFAEALRAAAVNAFRAPISGVKLDLDMAHLQGQLQQLKLNFTGNISAQGGPQEQQAAYTGPRTVPGLRPLVNDPKQVESAHVFYRELNNLFKSKGLPMLSPARDTAEEFTAITDRLGDAMNKIVKFASADPDREVATTGGELHKLLKNEPDEVKYGPIAEAASAFQFAFRGGEAFRAYRAAGPAPAMQPQQGPPPPPAVPASQEHVATLRTMEAAEAATRAAHRAQTEADRQPPVAGPVKQFQPISLDDLHSLLPFIAGRVPQARSTPYEPYVPPPENETEEEKRVRERQTVVQRRGNRDAQNQRLSVSTPASTPPIDVREFVSGRRSFGPTGLSAYGEITNSRGTDISPALIAGGLYGEGGRKFFESFGEVQKGGRGTSEVIPLSSQEIDRLKEMPGQIGRAGNRSQVKLLGPSELLRLLLVNNYGTPAAEAKETASWAVGEKGPLNARYLGEQAASSTGDMRGLSATSGGSGSLVRQAQEQARMLSDQRRLGELLEKQADLREKLAGTGVPAEQRRYSGALGSVAGQIGRLTRSLSSPMEEEGRRAANEHNEQVYQDTHQYDSGAIDANSKYRTTVGDRPKLIEALRFLGSHKGTSDRALAEVQKTLDDLIQGTLPPGEDPSSVGGFAGARTAGTMLHSQMRTIYEGVMEELEVAPTKRGGSKAMKSSLERHGDVQTAAGFDMLMHELQLRRDLAAQDTAGDRSGMSERQETTNRDRAYTRAPGAQAPADTIKSRTYTGDIRPAPIFERQSELDAIERRMAEIDSRVGSAAHDPMAMGRKPADVTKVYPSDEKGRLEGPPQIFALPGAPGGGFEERMQIGEGKILGKHAQVLAPVTGEIAKRNLRIREQVGRDMGVRFGEGGNPVLPDSGKISESDFENAVKAATDADEKIAELREELGGLASRHQVLAQQRKEFLAAAPRPQLVTEAPAVRSGDDERRGYYKASLSAPQGGVPVSPEQIRLGQVGPPSLGMPAWTVPGAASQAGPSVTSAMVSAAMTAAGTGGPPTDTAAAGTPMSSGGVVRVWIAGQDGPLDIAWSGKAPSSDEGEEVVPRAPRRRKAAAAAAVVADANNTQEGPVRSRAQFERDLRRVMRDPQLLLPAVAGPGSTQEAPAPAKTQAAPISYKEAQHMPAGVQIVVDENGVNRIVPEAEMAKQAKAGLRQAMRPTPNELALSLRGTGLFTDDEIASSFARQPRVRRDGTDVEGIIAARQMSRQAQANLSQRALGTTFVQLTENLLGGRKEPTERILRLNREISQVQRLASGLPSLDEQRRDTGRLLNRRQLERRRIIQAGGQVPANLDREVGALTEQFHNQTGAWKKLRGRVDEAADKLLKLPTVGTKDILQNLGAGFIGGIGGGLVTMGVSAVVQTVVAASGVIAEAFKPAYEAAIGYQNVTNKVVDSLSDQLRANHGLATETVALAATQAGLSDGVYKSIAPQLKQAATVEAGNKAYGDYIDMVRSAERIDSEGPRGLFHATNGVNILGLQTPLGATPSTMENFLDQFNGIPRGGGGGPLGIGLPDYSADAITNTTMQIGELGTRVGDWIRNIDPTVDPKYKGDQTPSGPTMATRMKDINDQLTGINSNYRITNDATKDIAGANKAQADIMRKYGVDDGKIASFEQLGVAFTDTSGKIITSGDQLVSAWNDMARSYTQISPTAFLDQSANAMRGQIWGIGAQGDLQRSQVMQQYAVSHLASPPVYGSQVLGSMGMTPFFGGTTGAPSQFTQGVMPGMLQSAPLGALNAQLQQAGQAQLQQAINNIPDPMHKLSAENLVPQLTEVGRLIHDTQVDSQKIQLAQQFRGWNYQLEISKRNLGDVIGLNGKVSQGGVQATDLGQLQYQAQQLSHTMQNQQFDHAQLSLNYQKALAGFLAPGATGEEIATRRRIAEKEAKFQQTQLTESKDLAGNQWQQTLIGNSRNLQAASHDYVELQQQITDAGKLFANQDIISKATDAQSAITSTLQSYLDEGNGMVSMANQYTQNLIALGDTADKAMADTILRMQDAATALANAKSIIDPTISPTIDQSNSHYDSTTGTWVPNTPIAQTNVGGNANVGPDMLPPEFFDPGVAPGSNNQDNSHYDSTSGTWIPNTAGGGAGLTDPYLTPMSTGSKHTVIINNPAAGVDTAALTRVVINELNRQGSLRNSPLG